jgi:hypothetical protein
MMLPRLIQEKGVFNLPPPLASGTLSVASKRGLRHTVSLRPETKLTSEIHWSDVTRRALE